MGARHVLLASSSAIYGTRGAHACAETRVPVPTSAYGMAKLKAEQALAGGAPPVTALRIGNVLGADALMLNAARASAAHPVHLDRFEGGDGPLRSYIGPATLAQVLETLLHAGPALPDVLNVGAPAPVAMQTLLEAGGTPYAMRPAPPEAVQTVTLDCTVLTGLHRFAADASTPGTHAERVASHERSRMTPFKRFFDVMSAILLGTAAAAGDGLGRGPDTPARRAPDLLRG